MVLSSIIRRQPHSTTAHSPTFRIKLVQEEHVAMIQLASLDGLAIGGGNFRLNISGRGENEVIGGEATRFMDFLI